MKKMRSLILFAGLALALFCTPVCAEAEASDSVPADPPEETAYVFQLSEDADPAQLEQLADAELLCDDAKLYRTDDLDLIRQLESENAVEQYAADGEISLDDMMPELYAASKPPRDYRRTMLGYDYAAEKEITGEGVKIALIDSGLWSKFSTCSSATILPGVNFLAAEGSTDRSNVDDTYGHGTFVASVICGKDIGLAPDVTILPLKCFDAQKTQYSYVIEAIGKAIEEECDIINLSLGGERYPPLEQAVQCALDKGIIIVASSGNLDNGVKSTGNDPANYPAAQEGVISVGAVDSKKAIWNRSVQNSSVCVAAPGYNVVGVSMSASSGYTTGTGTSYSAPLVTATAALALSVDDTLTAAGFISLLTSTAEDLGTPGKDNAYGYGLINPALLLATLLEDNETLIVTSWNDSYTGYSAYMAADQNTVSFMVLYDDNGQMLSVEIRTGLSCYCPDGGSFSLISVDTERFTPVGSARKMPAR